MTHPAPDSPTVAELDTEAPERHGEADLAALQRQGFKRFWLTLPSFGAAQGLLFLTMALGYAELWQVAWVSGFALTGLAGIYLLLKSGLALRSRDPMLIYPQVLFSVMLVALTYALVASVRGAVLQWLCLIIVFDMRRLPRREVFNAAVLAMVLPALGMLVSWGVQDGVQLGDELIKLALSGVLVPVLLTVSAFARMLNKQQVKTKEEMIAVLDQQRQLAMRDGLTGLYNRRHMLGLLEEGTLRQQRQGEPFCVGMLDIDGFKRINDQHGHTAGDLVLKQFAALGLQALGGRGGILARWGGEEFLVLMPGASQAQAHAALSHLRELVHAHDWSQQHVGPSVTFSAGLSLHHPADGLPLTLERADQALYLAKAQGRDRIEPASPMAALDLCGGPLNVSGQEVQWAQAAAVSRAAAARFAEPEPPLSVRRRPKALRIVARVLLGPDQRMHTRLWQCLIVSGIYTTAVLFVLFFLIPGGFIDRERGLWLACSDALPGIIPFLLVRSGITAKWPDPGIVLPQIIWACLQAAISYVVAPASRPYDLQVACVCLVFGFASLRPRDAVTAGVAAIALLVAAFLTLVATHPAEFLLGRELMQMAGTVFVLGLLTVQSRHFSLARAREKLERLALAATAEQVQHLLAHDALTGMFNRQHMQALLERECERHQRSGSCFGVALIDLDHFKRINDGHGHQVGDEALVGFARAAQQVLGQADVICRWGGEEFLVLFTDEGRGSKGMAALERLRAHIQQQSLCPSVPALRVTFSAGLAVRQPDEPLPALLERADSALYAAKDEGRNRCVLSQERPPGQPTDQRVGQAHGVSAVIH